MPHDQVAEGIKQGTLYMGLFRVNKSDRIDAYVSCDNRTQDIKIRGFRNQNRALEGDLVAIALLEGDELAKEEEKMNQSEQRRRSMHFERQKKCQSDFEETDLTMRGHFIIINLQKMTMNWAK